MGLPIPPVTPAAPTNIRDPFDDDDFIFELKMDGCALAHAGPNETRSVSRRGNVYKRVTKLAAAIHIELDCEAVLDGEIGQSRLPSILSRDPTAAQRHRRQTSGCRVLFAQRPSSISHGRTECRGILCQIE